MRPVYIRQYCSVVAPFWHRLTALTAPSAPHKLHDTVLVGSSTAIASPDLRVAGAVSPPSRPLRPSFVLQKQALSVYNSSVAVVTPSRC